MKNKKIRTVIGLMSGTSVNGIDAALVHISGKGEKSKVTLVDYHTYSYPSDLKKIILDISSKKCDSDQISKVNFFLGKKFAEASLKIAKKAGIKISDVDLIGSHGQTISHTPDKRKNNNYFVPSTLQIGEPCVIAETTGVTTIADFRTRDIAAGGIGAPLTPYANYVLFSSTGKNRIIQNIGGISNLTFLAKGGNVDDVISFDSGPGNMIIDSLMSIISNGKNDYDKGGHLAKSANVDKKLLEELLSHPYINRKPPKSTGREDFGITFSNDVLKKAKRRTIKDADLIATVTAFTALSIVKTYERFIFKKGYPDELIVCGGGAKNKYILNMLSESLPDVSVMTSADLGIPECALEAVSFAILANDTFFGVPNNIPGVTGAKRKVVLGKIVMGG